MTEDTKAGIKPEALLQASIDAVGKRLSGDAYLQTRAELLAAIDSIDARGEAVAHVFAHGATVRLDWVSVEAAHNTPAGTKLYAAPLCASQDGEAAAWQCPKCGKPYAGSEYDPGCRCAAPLCASQDGGGPELRTIQQALDGVYAAIREKDFGQIILALEPVNKWCQGAALAALRSPLPGRESTAGEAATSSFKPYHIAKLWLWKNGDHFLAFDNAYPCFEPGGDPMTLGEPFGVAYLTRSCGRESTVQAGAGEDGPGSPKARFLWIMAELEKRFPDPEPFSARAPEPRYFAMLDAALAAAPNVLAKETAHLECKFDDACERADKAETNVLAMREALEQCRRLALGYDWLPGWDCTAACLAVADSAHAALASPLPEPRAGEREPNRDDALKAFHAMSRIAEKCEPPPEFYDARSKLLGIIFALAASPIPTPKPQEGLTS